MTATKPEPATLGHLTVFLHANPEGGMWVSLTADGEFPLLTAMGMLELAKSELAELYTPDVETSS